MQYSNSSTDIVSARVEFLLGSVTAQGRLDLRQKVSVSFSKVLLVNLLQYGKLLLHNLCDREQVNVNALKF